MPRICGYFVWNVPSPLSRIHSLIRSPSLGFSFDITFPVRSVCPPLIKMTASPILISVRV